ncbi:metal ABC transporter ATP-binding protein [Luteimicrobium subarcticum]|uniref:Zinc/manganese transport system ATP-binding protein n=1 Tax=Luteimicrobium subarcticum TaxID=620910 RepID=A0A2M8WRS5_9MICO|nr:ABC transporter ATP-binding protein [Luteimicrobium subarcticum]PJI93642.1 zinc/manganese transport system ATP-binding protein [Luteimicrobium subarcticum]
MSTPDAAAPAAAPAAAAPGTPAADDVPALVFDDVGVVLGGRLVWSEGTFTVPQGSVTAVIGSNGSGKTTMLKVILGLVPVCSGTVTVLGHAPGAGNADIGYVPQDYTALSADAIRARDAVLLGLVGHRWALSRVTAAEKAQVERALASVGATELADRRLSQLSGGQRQRVAIAQAIVSEPRLVILDEPLASLDLRNQREIVELLGRINDEYGVTILVVAHDLNPLLAELDGAIYLLDGHAHHAPLSGVVDEDLLSHLYGTRIQVVRTPQGEMFMRSV